MTMPPERPLNPLAVISLVTSILPLQLVGVITGHIALSQIKRTGDRGHGLALAGVIVGYVGGALTILVLTLVGLFSLLAVPIAVNEQAAAEDSLVQSDITNAKLAIVTQIVSDPNGEFPQLDTLSDFTADPDTALTVSGDLLGFCIEGYSQSAEASGTATHFAASDTSPTVEGTCEGGTLVPAN